MNLNFRKGKEILLFCQAFRRAVGPFFLPFSGYWEPFPRGQSACDAYRSPQTGLEVDKWSYDSSRRHDFMACIWTILIKQNWHIVIYFILNVMYSLRKA